MLTYRQGVGARETSCYTDVRKTQTRDEAGHPAVGWDFSGRGRARQVCAIISFEGGEIAALRSLQKRILLAKFAAECRPCSPARPCSDFFFARFLRFLRLANLD